MERQLVREFSVGLVVTAGVGLLLALTTSALAGLLVALVLGFAGLLGDRLLKTRRRGRADLPTHSEMGQRDTKMRRSGAATIPSHQPSPALRGVERDELRELIASGEGLSCQPLDSDAIRQWLEEASSWLDTHRQTRSARRLRSAVSDFSPDSAMELLERGLVDARVLLVEHIPPGFALDLTPLEALERWMEVEAVPKEQRTQLREKAASYVQRS